MLRQLIMENASNLRKTLDEPLFAHDIRLPISPLSPASRRTFPVRSSPSDVPYCGSITPVSHDFAELSSVAAEVVSVVGSRRTMRRLNTAHSRPPSAKSWRTPRSAASGSDPRRFAPSRFGSSSPLGTSPRTSAADNAKTADKGSSAAEGKTPGSRSSSPPEKPGSNSPRAVPMRGIMDPNDTEEEVPVPRHRALPQVKPRSSSTSPQPIRERTLIKPPPPTYPRAVPRMAQTLLPTVRPKSARPPPLVVPFLTSSPARPNSCA
ncbi:unnamed protein product [Effrenium voratum]|nr:unnamed protein product [Effrenium voratum]